MRPLTPIEARVLGTLMEKARTVPDSYPLSLNALVTGCNQKTSREPVMEIGEDDARTALEALRGLSLVFEASSSRVTRYEHNVYRALQLSQDQGALLGLLLLRGPQTPAELRANGERWSHFADAEAVEHVLQELHQRGEDGGLQSVARLPKTPGSREHRWMHLLCGPVDEALLQPGSVATPGIGPGAADTLARITRLENQVARMQQALNSLCEQMGLPTPSDGGPS